MKKRTAFYFLVLGLLLAACGNPVAEQQTQQEAMRADSIGIKLNSPELKAVNAELLKDPSSAVLYNKRAKIYLGLQQLDEAVYDAQRAIKLDSTVDTYYLTLVDAFFSRNNTRKAKELLEITERKFPSNTEALLKLAELYFLVKQYQKGIDYANKALKLDENLARGYYIKGSIYRESGDTAKAISSFETAVEQDNRYEDAFYDLGLMYASRKNPLAFQYYDNVLRINPASLNARYARAKLLQDLGKTDEALKAYEETQTVTGKCDNCLYNSGAIYLELKDDPKKAVDYFSKAIVLNNNFAEAYFARAYAYTRLGDKESARADYKMCLKLQPNNLVAREALEDLN